MEGGSIPKFVNSTKVVQDAMKDGFMHAFGTADEKRRDIIINDIDALRKLQTECFHKAFTSEVVVSSKIEKYNREHGEDMKDQFENFKNEVNDKEREQKITEAQRKLKKVADESEKLHDEVHYPIRTKVTCFAYILYVFQVNHVCVVHNFLKITPTPFCAL